MKNWELCRALEEGRKFKADGWETVYNISHDTPYRMRKRPTDIMTDSLDFKLDWQEVKEDPKEETVITLEPVGIYPSCLFCGTTNIKDHVIIKGKQNGQYNYVICEQCKKQGFKVEFDYKTYVGTFRVDKEYEEQPINIREIMAFMAGSTRAFRYSKNGLWMINPSNDESDDYMTECEWCETSGPRAWEPRQFTREEMGI